MPHILAAILKPTEIGGRGSYHYLIFTLSSNLWKLRGPLLLCLRTPLVLERGGGSKTALLNPCRACSQLSYRYMV